MGTYMFWVKVFALSFAMGVVSRITMSFQFGANWPSFMETVGNVAGPLLAYEVMTAFFLEAVFLEIMLFGASSLKPVGLYTGNLFGRLWHHNVDLWDHRFEFMDAHTSRV